MTYEERENSIRILEHLRETGFIQPPEYYRGIDTALEALNRYWVDATINNYPSASDSGPQSLIVRVSKDGKVELVEWWHFPNPQGYWFPLPPLP